MIDKNNIERFYDYFDFIANKLYETSKKPYVEGMNEAFNYLLDDQFTSSIDEDLLLEFKQQKEVISGIEFDREEVRKAVQLGLLKGYKHTFTSNALITPDTIGIFISYIVKKLYHNKELNSILDPLVGTGNLLYTVLNQLDKKPKAYGIDHDLLKCNVSRNLGDLLDYKNEMFYQDTLKYYDSGFDLIILDTPIKDDQDEYIPYQIINHHMDGLQNGKYMIAIIDNDFFEQKDNDVFKKEIQDKAYLFGLITLNESLFTTNPKSILILRKKKEDVDPPKDFLLVELPSFSDMAEFNKTINHLDLWFSEREEII